MDKMNKLNQCDVMQYNKRLTINHSIKPTVSLHNGDYRTTND